MEHDLAKSVKNEVDFEFFEQLSGLKISFEE
jgi:hypothetical protein